MTDTGKRRLPAQAVIDGVLKVLGECFESAAKNGAFLDPGPNGLLRQLERQYATLVEIIRENAEYDEDSGWYTAGVLAHSAYHLGALRVKVDELRK